MRASPFLLLLVACTGGVADLPPDAPVVGIAPELPGTDDGLVVVIRAPSTDPDGEPVTYTYAWFQDGFPRADLTGDTVPASETAKGEVWEVQVTPNDGTLDGDPVTAGTTVVNSPPALTLALAGDAPASDEDVVLVPTATDPDGDTVTFAWTWTVDGLATQYVTETVPAEATARGEMWSVSAVPTDGEDAGAAAALTVEIGNSAPFALAVALSPEAPAATDTILASVEGEDDDGDTIDWTYDWWVDGTLIQSGPSDALAPGSFAKHQEILVEVTPADGIEAGAPLASASVVARNTPPSATAAALSPEAATEATTLTCVGAGYSDPDGDPEGWTWQWYVGGASAGMAATLDGASFSRGDVVWCEGTPYDGEEAGATVASAPLTVADTAPVITGATLSTLSPTEMDTVSVALVASDADGDTIVYSYAWFVDGRSVSTDETLTGASFVRGAAIYVVVTPTDDTLAGAPVASDVATAVNSAPVANAVTLSSAAPATNDTLSVTVSGTDADGDVLTWTYAWYVDGAPAGSGSTLSGASAFDKGETVWVVVTPNDGTVDGAPLTSDAVGVVNTAPSAPGAAVEPELAYEGDELICSVSVGSTDVDGDVPTYRFAWSVDGASYTGATDSAGDSVVPGADVAADETWTCTVTADDGDGGVASASASTFVWWYPTSWTQVYSNALTSLSGITRWNGSLGGQTISSVGGRSCFLQYSDWNQGWLTPTRSGSAYEAVEVDVYIPTSASPSLSFYLYDSALWFSATGSTWTFGDSATLGTGTWTPNTWNTVRVEVDHVAYVATVYINGTAMLTDVALSSPGSYTSDAIAMHGSGSYGSTANKACWSNLEIYEGTR